MIFNVLFNPNHPGILWLQSSSCRTEFRKIPLQLRCCRHRTFSPSSGTAPGCFSSPVRCCRHLAAKEAELGEVCDHIFSLFVSQEGCFEWFLFQNFPNTHIVVGSGCQIVVDFVIFYLGSLDIVECKEGRKFLRS